MPPDLALLVRGSKQALERQGRARDGATNTSPVVLGKNSRSMNYGGSKPSQKKR